MAAAEAAVAAEAETVTTLTTLINHNSADIFTAIRRPAIGIICQPRQPRLLGSVESDANSGWF